MARYQIWNKTDSVITPVGEVLTPEQWIARYPMAGLDNIKFVIAGGTINGAFAGEFNSLVELYQRQGCDFTGCTTDQDYLDKIEEFENTPQSTEPTAEERIAAQLEYQSMMLD